MCEVGDLVLPPLLGREAGSPLAETLRLLRQLLGEDLVDGGHDVVCLHVHDADLLPSSSPPTFELRQLPIWIMIYEEQQYSRDENSI